MGRRQAEGADVAGDARGGPPVGLCELAGGGQGLPWAPVWPM